MQESSAASAPALEVYVEPTSEADLVLLAEILVIYILDHDPDEIIKLLGKETQDNMIRLVNTPIDDGKTPLEHAHIMYKEFIRGIHFQAKDFNVKNTKASLVLELVNFASRGLAPVDVLPPAQSH